MATPHGHSRRRVIKACTACKQSKVRCDADGKLGKPCSRCNARGLECEVDAHFKRTPVRERMKAMAAELRELRQTVREGPSSPDRRYSESFPGHDIQSGANGFAYPSPDSFQYSGPMAENPFGLSQVEEQDLIVEPTSLGPFEFSLQEISECFRLYFEHFHPNLPIINATTPIGALQRSSPFLFKTIIVIVCQRYHPLQRSSDDLHLAEVYQNLLNQTILSAPLSLHTIQALLLICTWPMPPAYQLAEPSWLYCGVAMNAASYLNLGRTNKPYYQGGQLSQTDIDNMNRTWLALFLVSSSIATFIGAPLPFKHSSDLNGIETLIARKEVPQKLAARCATSVVVARHSSVLSPETDYSTQDALVQMHNDELDRIPQKHSEVWNEDLEFFRQAAKLHMYLSLWIRGCSINGQHFPDFETHRPAPSVDVLVSATACACRIITIYDRLIGDIASPVSGHNLSSSTQASVLPKNYFRRVTHAAFFLLRFVCFNKALRESDRENAREHIHLAGAAIKRTSRAGRYQRDEAMRSANLLEKLLEHGDMLQEQRLQIDDRGASSIFWDTIHRTLQLRGRSTAHTDLMELIDPTRVLKQPAGEFELSRNNQMPTPGMTSVFVSQEPMTYPNEDGVLWDDSLMEFFDLNMFDVGDFGT